MKQIDDLTNASKNNDHLPSILIDACDIFFHEVHHDTKRRLQAVEHALHL